jgi:phosphate uptake regulator
MLRELISILRSRDPLSDLTENFTTMLKKAQEAVVRAGDIFFEGTNDPKVRGRIYALDVEVNKLERDIRMQVISHLSLGLSSSDLPYCLLLTSLVKDVERIGDYAKNLSELGDLGKCSLPDDDLVAELREIRAGVESAFERLAGVFSASDRESALEMIQHGKAIGQQCESLIRRIAQNDTYDACTVAALVLGARFYKRIGGHVLNVLSSVVMPLHKVDYFDEDELEKMEAEA